MVAAALRPGRDDDAAGFIDLIGACWAEYPGCVMDMERENAELRALATYYADKGGALWAVEAGGAFVGMTGVAPLEGGAWEIGKVYVAAGQRGTGLALSLMTAAEARARASGATELKLWSDTRFTRAHTFYEKHGFVRAGAIRVLNDLSNSLEYAYAKPLSGVVVRRLDVAAAESAGRVLADILCACVDADASVSFLPPLAPNEARRFYRARAKDVAAGTRMLLAGWVDGALSGTVMLDMDTPPNQPHRAEVQKLLVHPNARRHGLARALMAALEREAQAAGRRLLTLDTRAEDAAECLYRAIGYHEAGRIPRFALGADGTPCDTVLFWKEIA
jgi:GNAT superfamily N-acetyltransferase